MEALFFAQVELQVAVGHEEKAFATAHDKLIFVVGANHLVDVSDGQLLFSHFNQIIRIIAANHINETAKLSAKHCVRVKLHQRKDIALGLQRIEYFKRYCIHEEQPLLLCAYEEPVANFQRVAHILDVKGLHAAIITTLEDVYFVFGIDNANKVVKRVEMPCRVPVELTVNDRRGHIQ